MVSQLESRSTSQGSIQYLDQFSRKHLPKGYPFVKRDLPPIVTLTLDLSVPVAVKSIDEALSPGRMFHVLKTVEGTLENNNFLLVRQ